MIPVGRQLREHDRGRWTTTLVISSAFVAAFLAWSFFWMPVVDHQDIWIVAQDAWGPVTAGRFVFHGAFGYLYSAQRGYYALPLSAILVAPLVGLADHLGLVQGVPFPAPRPTMWLLLGPYTLVLSAVPTLYAARALAWEWSLRRRLWVLQLFIVFVVLIPCAALSHFEDSMALAFLLFALRALHRSQRTAVAVLLGAAICSKQWALLALPLCVVAAPASERRRIALYAVGLPAALALVPLIVDRPDAVAALITQKTPTHLFDGVRSPMAALGTVASRWSRSASLLLSLPIGLLAVRRQGRFLPLLAVVLVARGVLEPVSFTYYYSPGFAVLGLWLIERRRVIDVWSLTLVAAPILWAMPYHVDSSTWWWIGACTLAAGSTWALVRRDRSLAARLSEASTDAAEPSPVAQLQATSSVSAGRGSIVQPA